MPQLIVDVDEAIVQTLQAQVAAHCRSVEDEQHDILQSHLLGG